MWAVLAVLSMLAVGALLLRSRANQPRGDDPRATLSLVETLGGADTAGYRRALEPRPFRFPDDHGPHPGFRTEWWYLTANLEDPDGRRFGVQFTLFRSALSPEPPPSSSPWATNQAYMAHFAVLDAEADRFHAFERVARGAVGLAGARAHPFRAWLEDWALEGAGQGAEAASSSAPDPADGGATAPDAAAAQDPAWPMRLTARAAGETRNGDLATGPPTGVRLTLSPLKPVVLQGEDGLSRKGPEPGNASYYYSFSRLAAEGEIEVGGRRFAVTGTAWLDREWSTSVLSAGQVGWDWFALQLDDGRDLMVYQLRHADGARDPLSQGVLVAADGRVTRLGADDFSLEATDTWTSPLDGTRYPSAWRIEVPGEQLRLEVRPVRPDQELDLSFRYWEGAVDVTGVAGGQAGTEGAGAAAGADGGVGAASGAGADGWAGSAVSGRGYAEHTGYAELTQRGGR